MALEKNTLIKRSDDILFNTIDDEVIMMSVKNGEYYGLDAIGTWIWDQLVNPMKFGDLIQLIMKDYDVKEEECYTDVYEFIVSMKEKGLVIFE